ncbi:hypothetical protein G6045_36345 [Streptomyces sp. YC504]|uniref:Lipoprotein n=1 Tax=Streptomyces mesophilus TaxID=1775132 RepID=A0A6G4XV44_9ACTN|nr:hypothetical protein [Streptomyces mesophilus]NGO81093.1 hypothetical protein [Streptomyces mesophilus]
MGRASAAACTATLITALTAFTAVGCASSVGDGKNPDRPAQDFTHSNLKGQERDLTDAEEILVEHAESILVKECMEGKGFRYWVAPRASVAERQGGGYILDDVNWARTYGYGREFEKKAEQARLADPNAAYANALPKADLVRYTKTLDGDLSKGKLSVNLPSGGTVSTTSTGCLAEAKGKLYGDTATWFRVNKIGTSLTPLYVPHLVKDPRFVKAVETWSRCMRKAGHAYASPAEIREQRHALTQGMSADRAHATEVQLAVTEATCAVKTSLGKTARALEREYRAKKLQAYSEDIAAYQRMRLAALPRAENITDSEA